MVHDRASSQARPTPSLSLATGRLMTTIAFMLRPAASARNRYLGGLSRWYLSVPFHLADSRIEITVAIQLQRVFPGSSFIAGARQVATVGVVHGTVRRVDGGSLGGRSPLLRVETPITVAVPKMGAVT